MSKCHPTHDIEWHDSSHYEFVCKNCNTADNNNGWGKLADPCPVFSFEICDCPNKYTIEPHGDGMALYYGRCNHRHGCNLANIKEPASNFDPKEIERLLNRDEN